MVKSDRLTGLEEIPFRWGSQDPRHGLDCFTYAAWVHRLLAGGEFDLEREPISDGYRLYPHGEGVPHGLVMATAKALLTPRAIGPMPMDLVVVNSPGGSCLGTHLVDGDRRWLAAMFHSGSRLVPWERVEGWRIAGVFSPEGILKTF